MSLPYVSYGTVSSQMLALLNVNGKVVLNSQRSYKNKKINTE